MDLNTPHSSQSKGARPIPRLSSPSMTRETLSSRNHSPALRWGLAATVMQGSAEPKQTKRSSTLTQIPWPSGPGPWEDESECDRLTVPLKDVETIQSARAPSHYLLTVWKQVAHFWEVVWPKADHSFTNAVLWRGIVAYSLQAFSPVLRPVYCASGYFAAAFGGVGKHVD